MARDGRDPERRPEAWRNWALVLVAVACLAALGLGAAFGDPRVLFAVAGPTLFIAWLVALGRLDDGMGRQPTRPEHLPFIGRRARVTAVTDWGLMVSLDGVEGPARLPPFTPPPPPGSIVVVEAVADDVLVVRPEDPPRDARPPPP